MSKKLPQNWLNDDALPDLKDLDRYGRAKFVDHMVHVLNEMRGQSTSGVLGLVGSWGSGKSSVLDSLVYDLKGSTVKTDDGLKDTWLVAKFNPWLYEDAPSLHSGFFSELREAMPKGEKWSSLGNDIVAIGEKLKPFARIVDKIGVPASDVVEGAQSFARESESKLRRRVEENLTEQRQPIVMIIDDLDRLSASELMLVFKLVRLVGRLPYVYYVLSYDERTLMDLIEKTDLVGSENEGRASDYLEKIVQIRVDLPTLRTYEVQKFVDEALQEILSKHQINVTPTEMSGLNELFDGVLTDRLRTPRALKRFFAQLDSSLLNLRNEVNFSDFTVVTWIRTFEPSLYNTIQAERSTLLGERRVISGSDHPQNMDAGSFAAHWTSVLKSSKVADDRVRNVKYLLEEIFPALKRRGDERAQNPYAYASNSRPGRVSHRDYFDRYFSLSVTAEDISDAEIRFALSELAEKDLAGPNVARAAAVYEQQPHLVISKISDAIEVGHTGGISLIHWLLDRHSAFRVGESMANRIEQTATQALVDFSEGMVESVSRELSATRDGLYLLTSMYYKLASEHPRYEEEAERRAARHKIVERVMAPALSTRFSQASKEVKEPSEMSRRDTSMFFTWSHLDPEGAKSAIHKLVDQGHWESISVLGWMIIGGELIDSGSRLSGAQGFVDIDKVQEDFASEIANAPSVGELVNQPATPENRRAYAAALLAERVHDSRV